MSRFQVSTHEGNEVEVSAGNWLVALGLGLDAIGVVASIDRLACEVLPGGTVIVRDVRTGERFVVQPLAEDGAPRIEIDDPETEEDLLTFGEIDEDPETDSFGDVADPEELALFSIDAAGGRGENIYFSSILPDAVVMPGAEELALPADDTDDVDPRIEALCMRIEEAATPFDAWKMALEGACRIIGAESGAALSQEADGALRFLFATGPRANEVLGRRLPPGQGIAGFCTQRDVGLLITEPSRDPRFFSRMDQATGYTTSSLLAVPVSTEDLVLGCLELLNAPSGFEHSQLEMMSALAYGLAERLCAS